MGEEETLVDIFDSLITYAVGVGSWIVVNKLIEKAAKKEPLEKVYRRIKRGEYTYSRYQHYFTNGRKL